MGSLEIYVRKVAAEKFHAAGQRFGQVSPRKNRFRHVRIAEIRFVQICAREIGSGEPGFAKVTALKVCVAEDCAGQVDLGQVRVRKVCAGQVSARSSGFAGEKAFVRFQDFRSEEHTSELQS